MRTHTHMMLVAAMGVIGLTGPITACNKSPVSEGPAQVGSETHWLSACSRATDCPAEAACLCGVCTVTCSGDAECASAGDTAGCVPADSADLATACGTVAPAPVCAAGCGGDADCAVGLHCHAGRCLPDAPPDVAPDADAGLPAEVQYTAAIDRMVDVLFVVDNSGSMCEEQGNLSRAVAAIAAGLQSHDFRFAVVTTDMRSAERGRFLTAPPADSISNCANPVPLPDDCASVLTRNVQAGQKYFAPGLDTPTEEIAATLQCLVARGTDGDGFEKGLEAMRTALSCTGPQAALFGRCCVDGHFDASCNGPGEAPQFLRPQAELWVLFLSDEGDCSDPQSNQTASNRAICRYFGTPNDVDRDRDNVPDFYADPALCGDLTPAECMNRECDLMGTDQCWAKYCQVNRGNNNNCEWHREALTPVSDYADFLLSLKPDPRMFNIVPIVGPTAYVSGGEVHWQSGMPRADCAPAEVGGPAMVSDACCPDGLCTGAPAPTCESPNGTAYSGSRYLELAASFPGDLCATDSALCNICFDSINLEQDFLDRWVHLEQMFCMPAPVGRGETVEVRITCPAAPDQVPGCDVFGDTLAQETFVVVPAVACPSGQAVRLSQDYPGATVEIRVAPGP